MKVGTDAVLLGAWVEVGEAKSILDIGTGSGVIALMMAQRSDFGAHVDAVEPDMGSVNQARENVRLSPWPDKVEIFNTSIQQFETDKKYDLIVCNPPYFSKSLLPPMARRQTARHTETLSFEELLVSAKNLLTPHGTLAVILPFSEGSQFLSLSESHKLTCYRSTAFYSREGKPQERWLLQFSRKNEAPLASATLVLYETGDQWTKAYSELTKEFYLR